LSDKSKNPANETHHPDIQEILAKRREMLNRVRADLRRVDELQDAFWKSEQADAEKNTKRP
jgi:hypothetical protein